MFLSFIPAESIGLETQSQFQPEPYFHNAFFAISILLYIVSTVFVGLRIYANTVLKFRLRAPDDFMVFAWIFYTANLIYMWIAIPAGRGEHIWNLPSRQFGPYMKYMFISSSLNAASMLTIKLAIFYQLLEIFAPKGINPPFQWTVQALISLNAYGYSIAIWLPYLACIPRDDLWSPEKPGLYCKVFDGLAVATSVINAVTDAVIATVPQIYIWKLQTTKRRKLQTSAVFALGIVGCVAAIVQIHLAIRIIQTHDFSYYNARGTIFLWIEHGCAFCALGWRGAIRVVRAVRSRDRESAHWLPCICRDDKEEVLDDPPDIEIVDP